MNFLLYCITVGIWGSSWLAITYQLGSVPIDVSVFYRLGLASILMFGWCFFKRYNLRFSWKNHLFFAAQGLVLFSLAQAACYEASYYIPSGLNAIGFSIVLVFNIINSAIFYRTPLTFPLLMGALSGITGITTIFWPSIVILDIGSKTLLGILLSLAAGLLASFGNIISIRNQKANIPVTESNAYGMGYGTLWMLGILFLKGTPLQVDFSFSYILSSLYLAIFASIVAYGCYFTLLGRIGASSAAYALVVTPVISLILSTFFENFVWDLRILTGIGLILLGNVIILGKKTIKAPKLVANPA
ncbi:MAG: DMT family transporter [Proteobacteria bacterium]|nr:DMT family transporter [Pseudomonadota bacterium]